MSEEKRKSITLDLQKRICYHIARGDIKKLKTIMVYHMEEVRLLSEYMVDVIGDWLYDARVINHAFYMALKDLNIDVNSMCSVPNVEVGLIAPEEDVKLKMAI